MFFVQLTDCDWLVVVSHRKYPLKRKAAASFSLIQLKPEEQPNAGAAPRRSAAGPQGFSARCWRRHGLCIGRRVRGPSADKDVPPLSLLRTAGCVAREAGRAPRFRAPARRSHIDGRPLWPPSSTLADESSPCVRVFARRRSVRARSLRLSSNTP